MRDEDADQDAWVLMLERQARGEEIHDQRAWLSTAAWRCASQERQRRFKEARALWLYAEGDRTDRYGKPEPLHGDAWRERVRMLARQAARRRRQRKKEKAACGWR